MIESLFDALGTSGVVLSVFVALYLITRLPWWTMKACVGGADLVESVREKSPHWRSTAAGWITKPPEDLRIWGFFAFLLWPVMILLNLVLLAQASDGGPRRRTRGDTDAWFLYPPVADLSGGLFSLSQTVFGVMAGEVKKKSRSSPSSLILCVLTIVVEMGLAGSAARLSLGAIPARSRPQSPTRWCCQRRRASTSPCSSPSSCP